CEHLDESLRSAQQATADMQGALDAFRKDRRLQGPMEDPLELLEWKAPREARETAARPLRAVLAVKRSRAADGPASARGTADGQPVQGKE
ncbi:unnamed protein product, partial [Symbiodinium necroappetens]